MTGSADVSGAEKREGGPASSPCHPPTRVRYLVLAAACSLAVLTYVQRQGYVAGLPYIKNDLGLNDEQVGYLASVWLVAYGLFQVPVGLLGDRFGARHLLTFLVLGWSLLSGAVALTAALPSGGWLVLGVLAALRFLFGAFQAGGFPVLARVLADWMPVTQRGFAQGTVWTFSRVGGFLAPLLVVALIKNVFADWVGPLWLIAGLGVLWCAVFWPWFRNRPEEMREVNDAELKLISSGQASLEKRGRLASSKGQSPFSTDAIAPLPWWRFLVSVNVWALSLMYGFLRFFGNFITSLLSVYLRGHRQLSDEATAWVSGLPLAAGAVSCLLGGVASDWLIRRTGNRKWGRRLVGCAAMALAGLATFATPWVGEVWLLAVVVSAWFFFNDAAMGPAWASCADVGERYAGTLSGAMNMTGSLFAAVGMGLAGRLLHQGRDDVVFVIFAGSYALAALCWLAVDVTKPLVPKVEEL